MLFTRNPGDLERTARPPEWLADLRVSKEQDNNVTLLDGL
jgi:hypothetical protein